MPVGAETFAEAVRWSAEIYQSLKKVLSDKGHRTTVGDEGGFAPSLPSNEGALKDPRSDREGGLYSGEQAHLALDPAVSEIYQDGKYVLAKEGRSLTGEEMVEFCGLVRALSDHLD